MAARRRPVLHCFTREPHLQQRRWPRHPPLFCFLPGSNWAWCRFYPADEVVRSRDGHPPLPVLQCIAPRRTAPGRLSTPCATAPVSMLLRSTQPTPPDRRLRGRAGQRGRRRRSLNCHPVPGINPSGEGCDGLEGDERITTLGVVDVPCLARCEGVGREQDHLRRHCPGVRRCNM